MRLATVVLVLVAVLTAPGTSPAVQPATMSYQGVLKDAVGNAVPDGDYNLTFRLYGASEGGAALWTEPQTVPVAGGIFNAVLGSSVALTLPFDAPYWLGTSVGGGAELTPRVALTAAPYAFRAKTAEVATDGDWSTSGSDVYRIEGTVGVGAVPPARESEADEHGDRAAPSDRGANKLYVKGSNQTTVYVQTEVTADGPDGRASIYGFRDSGLRDPAHGFGSNYSNAAVKGYNFYGDYWSFGVAGHSWLDQPSSGGVLGTDESQTWAALAFKDSTETRWGVYTENNVHIGGTLYTGGLHMAPGAAAGYVLTSNDYGFASWQPAAGNVGGAGTAGRLALFTGPSTVGNSTITETATTISVPNAKGGRDRLNLEDAKGEALGMRLAPRFSVYDQNAWTLYADLSETDAAGDGRSAVYGYRTRTVQNDGSGYGEGSTNNAITGYNRWGDAYTFGVAGYSYNDLTRTGGVIGSKQDGSYWGALGYKDESSATWGIYTPNNAYVGGTLSATATNADKLENQHGAYYQDATNLNAGTLSEARLPQNAIDSSEIEDGTLTSADIQDGTIVDGDVSATAAIAPSKISGQAWTRANDGYTPGAASASHLGGYHTASTSWVSAFSVNVNVPATGYIFVALSADTRLGGNAWCSNFAIGVDGLYPWGETLRAYCISSYENPTEFPLEISTLGQVSAGAHTVHFLIQKISGDSDVYLGPSNLAVMYFGKSIAAKGN
jgi:hypothetical protein